MLEKVMEIVKGNKLQIAKAITAIEQEKDSVNDLLRELEGFTGNAHILGITGPPGSGKSTLTTKLALELRRQNNRVGIIAVDPSSPFSGGAILGDRIRMSELVLDEGVFIRSMSTRGHLGGLAKKTGQCTAVLDGAGYDVILIETVGVGQSEVDIVRLADTIIVVCVPGLGDDIQAIKAGILEIADIFVINKGDKEGTEKLKIELEQMRCLSMEREAWDKKILTTIAVENEGILELNQEISRHWKYLLETGELKERRMRRIAHDIEEIVFSQVYQIIQREFRQLITQKDLENTYHKKGKMYDLAESLLGKILI